MPAYIFCERKENMMIETELSVKLSWNYRPVDLNLALLPIKKRWILWNVFYYDTLQINCYSVLFFFLSFLSEKNTVGLFWNNAAETWIDIKSNVADKVLHGQMMLFMWGNDGNVH